jgi:hypothetical protein
LFEHSQHIGHGIQILSLLQGFRFGICINMLFGMDANEIAAHAEWNGQRIRRDLVSRNVRDS